MKSILEEEKVLNMLKSDQNGIEIIRHAGEEELPDGLKSDQNGIEIKSLADLMGWEYGQLKSDQNGIEMILSVGSAIDIPVKIRPKWD